MKKLLIGCMAAVAALIAFSGCDQDKVVYSGPNYLMFSDTLYTYAVQETNEIFNVPRSCINSIVQYQGLPTAKRILANQ